MNSEEAFKKFFEDVTKDLRSDQVDKGLYSSGKSASSLNYEVRPDGGTQKGSAYFQQQITGRRPGKMPPVEDILAWIEFKGIQSDNPESFAWAVAKKIAKVGTDVNQGKREGLDFIGIVAKNRDELMKNLKKGLVERIKTDIHLAGKR